MRGIVAAAAIVGLLPASAAAPMDDARAAIIKKLKDPESARFTEVVLNGEAVCGFVNAKNASGGYPGAHRFYYVIASGMAFVERGGDISTDPLDQMAQGYSKFCR